MEFRSLFCFFHFQSCNILDKCECAMDYYVYDVYSAAYLLYKCVVKESFSGLVACAIASLLNVTSFMLC